jgi:hypothetical protein
MTPTPTARLLVGVQAVHPYTFMVGGFCKAEGLATLAPEGLWRARRLVCIVEELIQKVDRPGQSKNASQLVRALSPSEGWVGFSAQGSRAMRAMRCQKFSRDF